MHFSLLCIIHDIISEIEFLLAEIMWRQGTLVRLRVSEAEREMVVPCVIHQLTYAGVFCTLPLSVYE